MRLLLFGAGLLVFVGLVAGAQGWFVAQGWNASVGLLGAPRAPIWVGILVCGVGDGIALAVGWRRWRRTHD